MTRRNPIGHLAMMSHVSRTKAHRDALLRAIKTNKSARSGRDLNRMTNRASIIIQYQKCFAQGVASCQDYVDTDALEHAQRDCKGRVFVLDVEALRPKRARKKKVMKKRKNPSVKTLDSKYKAYLQGYMNGKADRKLGVKSLYSFHGAKMDPFDSYGYWYSHGYRRGVQGLRNNFSDIRGDRRSNPKRKNPHFTNKKTLRKSLYTALTSSGAAKTVKWNGTANQIRMSVRDDTARRWLKELLVQRGIVHKADKNGVTVRYADNIKGTGRKSRPSSRKSR